MKAGFDPRFYYVKACSAQGCYGTCTGMVYDAYNECLTLHISYLCHMEVAQDMLLVLPEVPAPKSRR